jgi:hypothetical protein
MTFHRGARIKPPPETPITLNQACFVCCDIASKQGMTEADFLTHMMRAWMAMGIVNRGDSQANPSDV